MPSTEIQILLPNGETLGWPIHEEAEALAWRAAHAPSAEVRYVSTSADPEHSE